MPSDPRQDAIKALAEALTERGWTREPDGVMMTAPEQCWRCNGRGWYADADPAPSGEPGEPFQRQCGECGGTGQTARPANETTGEEDDERLWDQAQRDADVLFPAVPSTPAGDGLREALEDAQYEIARSIERARSLGDAQLVAWLNAADDDIDRVRAAQ